MVVVLQLTGANDYLNTVIPYTNPLYRDNRPNVGVPEDKVLPINDTLGFHPNMGPVKKLYDEGKVAIIHGIGYANSPRSHFRSMDIWHTCEPDTVGTEGWVGRVIRDLDPKGENVLKGVNFGQGLPRAMAVRGVPVTSVSDLAVLRRADRRAGHQRGAGEGARAGALCPHVRAGHRDGTGDGLSGANRAGCAQGGRHPQDRPAAICLDGGVCRHPDGQKSAEYRPGLPGAIWARSCSTRQHGSFDTHFNQVPMHNKLWIDVSTALENFFDDLREHDAGDNLIMVLFTEFGRRVHDNGTGTDHGAGGVAFVIGNGVRGGMYSEYPSLGPLTCNRATWLPTMTSGVSTPPWWRSG